MGHTLNTVLSAGPRVTCTEKLLSVDLEHLFEMSNGV